MFNAPVRTAAASVTALLLPAVLLAEPAIKELPVVDPPVDAPVEEVPMEEPEAEEASAFPTPAELAEQMKASAAAEAAKPLVAHFVFDAGLAESPSGPSLFGGGATTLRDVVDRLRMARYDEDVKAILLTFKPGAGMGYAQAQEIRDQLLALREAGKPVVAYADSYSTVPYLVASAASDVVLLGGGEVFVPGVAVQTMFYKGMFDKVGIDANYVQVGEFKGAEEPYVNTEPSEELRGEMEALVNGLHGQIVGMVAEARGKEPEAVRQMIDRAALPADEALAGGFVDHLATPDDLRGLIAEAIGFDAPDDLNLDDGYGMPEEESIDLSNPFAILASLSETEPDSGAEKVALLYAEGVIVDGEGGGGGLPIPIIGGGGPQVGSEMIRRAMREAERDELIKAIVIRIDSPGGSALASEAMWQAVRRVSKQKPVIISIGGMAASGGYYLASAGEIVYADPAAIVGSIGVVGGKLVLSDLYDKLGLTTTTFSAGANATLFSDTDAWSDRQRKLVRTWMTDTYDQFTDRILETRGDKIEDIGEVAKGRIFLAKDALELGMVDEIGGLEAAIADAAGRAGFTDTDYEVKVIPEQQFDPGSLFGGLVQAPIDPATALVLTGMSDTTRALIARQIQMADLMNDRPVILMTPYVISE